MRSRHPRPRRGPPLARHRHCPKMVGLSTFPQPHEDHVSHSFRHHRPALRQRILPHRPHHGVHPGRHLGAFDANGGPHGALRGCGRRAWRADHAEGGKGRHHTAGPGGALRRRAPAVPERLPHPLRPLALDRFGRERGAIAGHLPRAEGAGPDRDALDRAVLRPRQGHVPGRPLHQGANAPSATPRTSTAIPARSAARSMRPPN